MTVNFETGDPQEMCKCGHEKFNHRLPYHPDCMECKCEKFDPDEAEKRFLK
jgi:hypothetical protein